MLSEPATALPERLIIVCGEAEDVVHYSQFSVGTLHQHDEVLCNPVRLQSGYWRFAPRGVAVNCVLCLGHVNASS